MNKKNLLKAFYLLFMISLFSCVDNDSSSSTKPNVKSSIFGDSIAIPENFDWDTYKEVTLDITIDTVSSFKGYYTILVYDFNPLNNDSAKLISQVVSKEIGVYKTTIEVPSSLKSLYIMQKNPDGRKVVLVKNIGDESNVSIDFSKSSISNRSVSTEAETNEVKVLNVDITEDYEVPIIHTELKTDTKTSNLDWGSDDVYYLPSGVSLQADNKSINSQAVLYVQGSLYLDKDFKMSNKAKLIVLDGGKIITNDNLKIQLSGSCVLQVQKGGEIVSVDDKKVSFTASNDVTILLQGDVTFDSFEASNSVKISNTADMDVNDIDISNSTLFSNVGNIDISGNFVMSSDAEFSNEGNLSADKISITSSDNKFYNGGFLKSNSFKMSSSDYRMTNAGRIDTKDLNTTGGYVVCKTKSYIECETWNMTNSNVYFEDDVMMNVTEKTTFSNQDYFFGGAIGGKSLFKSKEIEFGWKTALYGNLDIASDKYNDNSRWNYYYVVKRDYITFCGYLKSMTTISKSDYSPGNNYVPEEEVQQDFPKWVSNTNNYTFVMEDLYPSFGDYDMNDLVISLDSIENYMNESNKVEQSVLHLRLRAVGGTISGVGFALQLDGIDKNNIQSVTNSNDRFEYNYFSINDKGLENGQDYPVIPIFDDGHYVFDLENSTKFINVLSSAKDVNAINEDDLLINIKIKYISPISAELLNKKYLNFFGIKNASKGNRYEIHVPSYDYTNLSSSQTDNAGYYMWALIIPGEFKYPLEYNSIIKTYPNFTNWAYSNKTEDLDWYDYPKESMIYKK